ncbi:unnamed protein product [Peronospora belbahrii]|uniref:Uncharacterized protein n=1 Tax=Peronospora belbahrii TaxID=622444 RepID=A0ABN8CNM0_9STRA|nr:unnamed protein product [Peronospora belbahrii]
MSLEESSVLMDRALVTMCQDLPESLGLYNTEKDQYSLLAIRSIPLLEKVGAESRKFVLIRDWMRAYEPLIDQQLSVEINLETLKEIDVRERKEKEEELENDERMREAVKKKKKKRSRRRSRRRKRRVKLWK